MPRPTSYHVHLHFLNKVQCSRQDPLVSDISTKEFVHTSSFFYTGATVKNCVCSLSLHVSLNVRRVNPDGLKNPQQLHPFFITYSCSVCSRLLDLTSEEGSHCSSKAQCNTPPVTGHAVKLWLFFFVFAKQKNLADSILFFCHQHEGFFSPTLLSCRKLEYIYVLGLCVTLNSNNHH